MKTYLVTGGAGFMGSNFIRSIIKEKGNKVINVDNLTYAGSLSTIKDLLSNKNHIFIKSDISNIKEIRNILFGRLNRTRFALTIQRPIQQQKVDDYLKCWKGYNEKNKTYVEIGESLHNFYKAKKEAKKEAIVAYHQPVLPPKLSFFISYFSILISPPHSYSTAAALGQGAEQRVGAQ